MGYRAGFVGLIGLPNSGKSTLLNTLVGEKVSIVTAKPQTTRRRSVGLITCDEFQILFVDAPGIVRSQSGLNSFLRAEMEDVVAQSDVLLAVLNIDEENADHLMQVAEVCKAAGKPWVVIIHKTDLPKFQVHRPRILSERLAPFGVTILQGSGLHDGLELRQKIVDVVRPLLPEASRPLYDPDLYTLSTTRDLCAEIVREKCFENLHQEIPFNLAVRISKFDETSGAVLKIYCEILVAKENHRPIVIGKDGQVLKRVGSAARAEIEKLTGRKCYIELIVKCERNWQRNSGLMKELGYALP